MAINKAKAKVVMKRGLFANLPSSADTNILYFCMDVGRIFMGAGQGKPLLEYSNVLSGFADKDELTRINPAISNKLYITNDNGVYLYAGNNKYVNITGSEHENQEVLDGLGVDNKGNLTFNGQPIGIGNTDGFMTKEEYATDTTGLVIKSDTANKLAGVENAQPNMYYGLDSVGNIGFHFLPNSDNGQISHGVKVHQKPLLNPDVNTPYSIPIGQGEHSENKVLVQAYKFTAGSDDIVETLKIFNNSNKDNFYYDDNNIEFSDGGCHIKNKWNLNLTQNEDGTFITEPINKSDFIGDIELEVE